MKTNSKNKVEFLTKELNVFAFFSLFMTTVVNGIITISNTSENIKFYYYRFYTIYNIVFVILLLIRIPFYRNKKRLS